MKPSPPLCTKQWMPGKVNRIVSRHTVCVDGMPRHVRDIRKQCSGVGRGSHGHLQADDLRERSVAIEPGGVPFTFFPRGDVRETGSLEQTNDLEVPELPPGEDEVPPGQEETDEVQLELEVERAVEEQIPLKRLQRIRRTSISTRCQICRYVALKSWGRCCEILRHCDVAAILAS